MEFHETFYYVGLIIAALLGFFSSWVLANEMECRYSVRGGVCCLFLVIGPFLGACLYAAFCAYVCDPRIYGVIAGKLLGVWAVTCIVAEIEAVVLGFFIIYWVFKHVAITVTIFVDQQPFWLLGFQPTAR